MLAVRAKALIDGRLAPSVDDVLALAEPILKHRMALTFAARAEGQRLGPSSPGSSRRWSNADGEPAQARQDPTSGAGASWRSNARRTASPTACPKCSWRRSASRRRWRTACTAAAAPGPARRSGSSASFRRATRAPVIDWRRSASSDHLYVREREWEAAHTVWLWPDLSPSMNFRSHLAPIDQARPRAGADAGCRRAAGARRRTRRPARPDAADRQPQGDDAHRRSHRSPTRAPRRSATPAAEGALWPLFRRASCSATSSIPAETIASTSRRSPPTAPPAISSQILDPGRGDAALRGPHRIPQPRRRRNAGSPTACESLRAQYQERLAAHRAELDRDGQAARLVVPRASHRPPAAEPLLTLIMRLQGGAAITAGKAASRRDAAAEART